MQLVFSPHLPQRYAYYIVSQQGIEGVPEHYAGQDTAPQAAARVPGAAAWPRHARSTAQQQQQQPAQHAPEGPQQQSTPQKHPAQPGQQQVPSMQRARGAAAGGLQTRQHVPQQQSAQRPHGGLQHQQVRAVPPSYPGRPMPESAQPAQILAQSNEGVRHSHPGNPGRGTAQPPHIMLQSKQVAPSAAVSTWPQNPAQQPTPGHHLSSGPQPSKATVSVGQDASQQQVQAAPGPREPPFGVSRKASPRPETTGDWSLCSRPWKAASTPLIEALL